MNPSSSVQICLGILVVSSLSAIICVCQKSSLESFNYVLKECNQRLRGLESLSEFVIFMKHYKTLLEDPERKSKPFVLFKGRMSTCYRLEPALFELEQLVDDRKSGNVCHMSYINRLVDFHFKYISKEKTALDREVSGDHNLQDDEDEDQASDIQRQNVKPFKSSYLAYFFSLYAHQVASVCKSKLPAIISGIPGELECFPLHKRFVPPTTTSKEEITPENQDELKDVNKFLGDFKRIESFAPLVKSKISSQPFLDVMIPNEVVDQINSLKEECKKREPYYKAFFSPIATLSQIGYSMDIPIVDSSAEVDKSKLRCWLTIAQLCQGILITHLNIQDDFDIDSSIGSRFVSIKWSDDSTDIKLDDESNQLNINLHDSFDEVTPEVVQVVGKKFKTINKIKAKLMSWVKNFLEKHIDVEAVQKDAFRRMIEDLSDSNRDPTDTKIAFAGKKFNNKKFNPVSVVTDDADSVVQFSSPLWNKEISLIVSSVVAVALSAVFVWFSLYAITAGVRNLLFTGEDDGNIKTHWREMRDERVAKVEKKFAKKKPTMGFYKEN